MDSERNDALYSLGTAPIEAAKKAEIRTRRKKPDSANEQLILYMKTRQTYGYHVCDVIAQGSWSGCQKLLNELQRHLEQIYDTPHVELVNVYRKNNTKDDGIAIIAIFKIGPMVHLVEGARIKQPPIRAWWERVRTSIGGKASLP